MGNLTSVKASLSAAKNEKMKQMTLLVEDVQALLVCDTSSGYAHIHTALQLARGKRYRSLTLNIKDVDKLITAKEDGTSITDGEF